MRAVLVVSGARRERAAALGPRAPAARSLAGARRSRHRAARWIRFGPRVAGAGAGPPVLGAAGLQGIMRMWPCGGCHACRRLIMEWLASSALE